MTCTTTPAWLEHDRVWTRTAVHAACTTHGFVAREVVTLPAQNLCKFPTLSAVTTSTTRIPAANRFTMTDRRPRWPASTRLATKCHAGGELLAGSLVLHEPFLTQEREVAKVTSLSGVAKTLDEDGRLWKLQGPVPDELLRNSTCETEHKLLFRDKIYIPWFHRTWFFSSFIET